MNLTLFTSPGSGNSYKVELMLRLLNLPCQKRVVDLQRNEQLSTEFLARNRFGQIPVLVDGNEILTDSHAILLYLAARYGNRDLHDWAPLEPLALAHVMRWLSVAANEIQNGLAHARGIKLLNWPYNYGQAVRIANRILGIMEAHLTGREWLALSHATIADIACYPYVMLAGDGDIDTRPYPHVRAWQQRVEALPRFWPMPRVRRRTKA